MSLSPLSLQCAGFGLLFILLGLLAELQMRTYHESQGRTIYTVSRIIGFEMEPERDESAALHLLAVGQ